MKNQSCHHDLGCGCDTISLLKAEEKNSCHDLRDVINLVIDEVARAINSDNVSIMLFNHESGKLEAVAASGQNYLEGFTLEPGKGIAGSIFASNRAEIINDINSDTRYVKGDYIESSMMCAPLKIKDATIGVINVATKESSQYKASDLKLLSTLSMLVASSIENARLYVELKNVAAALEEHNRTLDLKVSERTILLAEANEKLKDANKALHRLSTTDALTGICNRRSFDEIIDDEWRRAMRYERSLALLFLDIDYFKPYNDIYGHLGGDECLAKVAGKTSDSLKRPGELAARYGGEEFVVLLPDVDLEVAGRYAEMIRSGIESLEVPHSGSAVSDYVTASIGVALVVPVQDSTPSLLVDAADQALYEAKEEGRNRYKISGVGA